MRIPWLIGLDLGQVHDPSALAIMQRHVVTWGDTQQQKFNVRYLKRFPLGMPYPEIVEMVKDYAEALPVPHDWGADQPAGPIRPYHLVIDATVYVSPYRSTWFALGGFANHLENGPER